VTTAALVALLAGTVIPALTALFTKDTASNALKALMTAGLSVVAGAATTIATTPPQGVAQWEQLVGTTLVAWIAAAGAYSAGWKPSGAAPAISKRTARFGLG
jgi:hypothetical protein